MTILYNLNGGINGVLNPVGKAPTIFILYFLLNEK
jgi:hypothetical protein